ncbi:MAG: hypothetical protein EXR99_04055 [Gemmataceae bacterium]|nr:hypothetical protein [Gemmataceae bacterium]
MEDVFLPCGNIRLEILTPISQVVFGEAARQAARNGSESIRTSHLFMGLLANPDASLVRWGDRLHADLSRLLAQFQELFTTPKAGVHALPKLHREFLSDQMISVLREAIGRSRDHGREVVSPMDLLVSLLTDSGSVVAECFERIGLTAAKLTELAVLAEQRLGIDRDSPI